MLLFYFAYIMSLNISIIGAGIGGLTLALLLQQRGYNTQIYEAAPAIAPVGAGIILANNAMQVFRQMEIHRAISNLGNSITRMNITNAQLQSLSSIDLLPFEQQYGLGNIAIHRADLHRLLVAELGEKRIQLNKKLQHLSRRADGFELLFADGTTTHATCLIGADGIKSTVRQCLFPPAKLRNAEQWCWRGLCDHKLPDHYQHQAIEAWHKGKRIGFVATNQHKVYWYALINAPANHSTQNIDLETTFADFHPDFRNILAATPPENMIRNDIIDLEPYHTWYDHGVCLLGDAAHATTPNLGQGACQAIEDAWILANALQHHNNTYKAFKSYQNDRQKKAHHVVNTSWQLGKIAHWQHHWATALRNSLLRNTPKWVNQRQMAALFRVKNITH